MHTIVTFIKVLCFVALTVFLQGCKDEEGLISEEDMSLIVSRMYLADQVIENNPEYMTQTDSILVYPAIMEEYGYTLEMYHKSLRYYLGDGERYNNILKEAKKILADRESYLQQVIKENQELEKLTQLNDWWATDSVRSVKPDELLYDKVLRAVRWMVMRNEMKQGWKMGDSAVLDIPLNLKWWENTLADPEREYRFYMIRSEEINDKENLNNEKDSGKFSLSRRKEKPSKKRFSGIERLK